MNLLISLSLLLFLYSCGMQPLFAEDSDSKEGKSEAQKMFLKRKNSRTQVENSEDSGSRAPNSVGAPRYLALQFGLFPDEETYKWGKKGNDDVGNYLVGVTYRVGEWTNSMDLAIRADLVTYEVDDKKPIKLSLLPVVTFPDAKSGFPLYFGAGVGLGVYFKQLDNESSLSFDYQLIAGTRFFNLLGSAGIIFEIGLKNQLFILSDGQHNGVYGSLGGVFTF
jgi:hypothetical protein